MLTGLGSNWIKHHSPNVQPAEEVKRPACCLIANGSVFPKVVRP